MSQPPARPWFRLASMVRPAPPPPTRPPAPQPVQQQTFRAPGALPSAPIPPRTSAPPSPVRPTTPAPMSSAAASPVPRATAPPSPTAPQATTPASPPPPRATAPPSAAKTPPATPTSPANHSPKSPAKTGDSQPAPSTTKSPTTTPSPPSSPHISSKPASPITKPSSSSLPASPAKKASPTIAAPRPDVSHSSLPRSPKTQSSAPPPSPLSTSPAFKTVPSSPAPPQPSPLRTAAAPSATVIGRATTPIASPKIDKPWVETPPQAAKEKVSLHPSPLTLPPPQLKAGSDLEPIPAKVEQKTVLLQETQEKSKTPPKTPNDGHLQRSHAAAHEHNSGHNGKREPKKEKGVHAHKKHSDSEEFGMRVVTLAGENKGAIMELSPSRKKYGAGALSMNGGQKLMEKKNDEGSSRTKDGKEKAAGTETAPMDAFINCNVQGVNNSILYNCACKHNDPGVHLTVSRNGKGGHAMK